MRSVVCRRMDEELSGQQGIKIQGLRNLTH